MALVCVAKVNIKAGGKLLRYVIPHRKLMSSASPQFAIYINSQCFTFNLIQQGRVLLNFTAMFMVISR